MVFHSPYVIRYGGSHGIITVFITFFWSISREYIILKNQSSIAYDGKERVFMKIRIKLLKPLSDAVGKNEVLLDFGKKSLADLLNTLIDQYPSLKKEIFKENNQLTEYINIFVNNKPFTALDGLYTELHNEDTVLLFVPISGG